MRVGSLFTGYGGLDLAAERFFGAETVWCSDIDPGACKIIEHRMPAPNLGDITKIDWADVEPVDILTGGWPCQPFSLAGKRKGADDERALWPEVTRAIRALRPRHVVLENVAAIATAGELARAVSGLAALGYVGSWRSLRAADIGAPHGRARIFILATNTDLLGHQRSGSARDGRQRPTNDGATPANTDSERHQQAFRAASSQEGGPHSAADGCHGTPPADAASNGWHQGRPEPAGQLGGSDAAQRSTGTLADTESNTGRLSNRNSRTTADAHDGAGYGERACAESECGGATTADANGDGRSRVGGQLALGCDADRRSSQNTAWGKYEPAIRRWERTLRRLAPPPTEAGPKGTQRLSPRFEEWMMGLPDGWVTQVPGLTRNPQMKALGNGVVPQQALAALTMMERP